MLIQKNEIIEDLKSVITGKTFDAILPPLVFVIANSLFGLDKAIIAAIGLALIISFARIYRRQTWQYAAGGLGGVVLATGIALLTRNAAGYFIPAIISSSLLVLLIIVSLLLDKPLAA